MARIASPSTWPEWQSEILTTRGPKLAAPGDVVQGRARLLGFEVNGRSDIEEADDEDFFEDVIVGVRMRIRYTVAPNGTGTVIGHQLQADLPAGPAGKVLSLFLARRLRRMQRELLERLRDQTQRDQAGELDPS